MLRSLYNVLEPKLITYIKIHGYSLKDFFADAIAGLAVAIIALPLAMAIAIASNLPPERGLFTGIVAGFLISALGGSRFQIGGPTAAFIVVVATVAMKHGYEGLVLATIMAGVMLIIMSLLRAGELIKFIPYPVIVGFTSGIALLIAFSQVGDFFGLSIVNIPPDFLKKFYVYITHIHETNFVAVAIALISIAIILVAKRYIPKVPGSILVVTILGFAVWIFNLPVETIESRFGTISSSLPMPTLPEITFEKLRLLLPDAFTIAILAAIESLLSAVVADGMSGTRHKSNAELMGQGVANIASGMCGGMPATGAIARTAANVKAGARSPVAGIMHALWLFVFILFLTPLIIKVPLASLAAILLVVAWNMSEIKHIKGIMQAPRSDKVVLIVTFLLTVFVDLNFAIQSGIALAAILFINQMMQTTKISPIENEENDYDSIRNKIVPEGVEVYEIQGPLFFGITERLLDILKDFTSLPKVFIIRMRYVPFIDAAGLHALNLLQEKLQKNDIELVLSGVSPKLYKYIQQSGIDKKIEHQNIVDHIDKALWRSNEILNNNK